MSSQSLEDLGARGHRLVGDRSGSGRWVRRQSVEDGSFLEKRFDVLER